MKFRSDEIDAVYPLVVQKGKLTLVRKKAKNVVLTPTFAVNFWNDEFGYFKFTRNAGKKVNGFIYTGGWIRWLRFSKT